MKNDSSIRLQRGTFSLTTVRSVILDDFGVVRYWWGILNATCSLLLAPPSIVSSCHGGRHRLVPFVLEEGGRFGDHALAILSEIADRLTLEPRQANLRPRSPGPAPIPRQPRLIGCAQVEAGGLGLVAGLRQASRASVYCISPRVRTLGL